MARNTAPAVNVPSIEDFVGADKDLGNAIEGLKTRLKGTGEVAGSKAWNDVFLPGWRKIKETLYSVHERELQGVCPLPLPGDRRKKWNNNVREKLKIHCGYRRDQKTPERRDANKRSYNQKRPRTDIISTKLERYFKLVQEKYAYEIHGEWNHEEELVNLRIDDDVSPLIRALKVLKQDEFGGFPALNANFCSHRPESPTGPTADEIKTTGVQQRVQKSVVFVGVHVEKQGGGLVCVNMCSGAIVTEDGVVLTAAHTFVDFQSRRFLYPESSLIYVGLWQEDREQVCWAYFARISDIIPSPDLLLQPVGSVEQRPLDIATFRIRGEIRNNLVEYYLDANPRPTFEFLKIGHGASVLRTDKVEAWGFVPDEASTRWRLRRAGGEGVLCDVSQREGLFYVDCRDVAKRGFSGSPLLNDDFQVVGVMSFDQGPNTSALKAAAQGIDSVSQLVEFLPRLVDGLARSVGGLSYFRMLDNCVMDLAAFDLQIVDSQPEPDAEAFSETSEIIAKRLASVTDEDARRKIVAYVNDYERFVADFERDGGVCLTPEYFEQLTPTMVVTNIQQTSPGSTTVIYHINGPVQFNQVSEPTAHTDESSAPAPVDAPEPPTPRLTAASNMSAPRRKSIEAVLPPIVIRLLDEPDLKLQPEEKITALTSCIEYGRIEASKAEGKDLIMVIGNSGTGKSTLVNYLCGCEMEQVKIDGESVIRVKKDSKIPELMKIGHTLASKTFVPEVAEASGFTLCDCPGFRDTRDAVINIANAVNIKQAIHAAKSVRVILLVTHQSLIDARARGIRELQVMMSELFGDLDNFVINNVAGSVMLGVTKGKAKDLIDDVIVEPEIDFFKNPFVKFRVEEPAFVDALLSNIFVYHPLDKGNDTWSKRAHLTSALNELSEITAPQEVFHTVLNLEDERELRTIVGAIGEKLEAHLKSEAFDESAKVLCHMESIEKVDNVVVTRLLWQAKKRVADVVRNCAREVEIAVMQSNFDEAESRLKVLAAMAESLTDALCDEVDIRKRKELAIAFLRQRRAEKAEIESLQESLKEKEERLRKLEAIRAEDQARVHNLQQELQRSNEERKTQIRELKEGYKDTEDRIRREMESANVEEKRKLEKQIAALKCEQKQTIEAKEAEAKEAQATLLKQLEQSRKIAENRDAEVMRVKDEVEKEKKAAEEREARIRAEEKAREAEARAEKAAAEAHKQAMEEERRRNEEERRRQERWEAEQELARQQELARWEAEQAEMRDVRVPNQYDHIEDLREFIDDYDLTQRNGERITTAGPGRTKARIARDIQNAWRRQNR